MSRSGARAVVSEIVPAGRGLAARPAFSSGRPVALSRDARGRARIGDLATVLLRGRGGRVTEVHGRAGDPAVVMQALLADAGRRRGFGAAARAEAEAADTAPVAEDPGRRDLTGQPVVTIDPEGAKDHDDAIYVERRDGGFRLFVHIADVARHIAPGGPLDTEAAKRSFSAYVPGTVDPMLPEALSAGACSLHAGVNRPVVTVEIDFDAGGRPRERRFYRAMVHSRRDLTYPAIDQHLAGAPLGDVDLERSVSAAHELAEALNARRVARGALEIAGAEPRFAFDAHGVTGVVIETQTASHRVVEECMIAANEAVAAHLLARGRRGIFRVHDDPDESSIVRLYDRLEALGVATPPLSEGPLTPAARREAAVAAARRLAAGGHGGAGERALQALVLRALKQARYATDATHHSGLASEAYLHFTSPIRRYPDLLAHRALLESIGVGLAPSEAELGEAAFSASEREREIAKLERRADRICATMLLARLRVEDRMEDRVEGEVVGLVGGGAFVAFGEVFEGFLPARAIGDDYFDVDPLEVALVGDRTGARLALGDAVSVRVVDVDPLRGRVELEPASGSARRRHRTR